MHPTCHTIYCGDERFPHLVGILPKREWLAVAAMTWVSNPNKQIPPPSLFPTIRPIIPPSHPTDPRCENVKKALPLPLLSLRLGCGLVLFWARLATVGPVGRGQRQSAGQDGTIRYASACRPQTAAGSGQAQLNEVVERTGYPQGGGSDRSLPGRHLRANTSSERFAATGQTWAPPLSPPPAYQPPPAMEGWGV